MNENNILEALEAIQQFCIKQTENCGKCIFDDRLKGCMFMSYGGFEGCPPSDWDLLRVKMKIALDKAEKL